MIPWQKAPFVRPTLGFISGILIAQWFLMDYKISMTIALSTLCLLAILFYKSNSFPPIQSGLLLFAFFFLGFTVANYAKQFPPQHFVHFTSAEDFFLIQLTSAPTTKNWTRAEAQVNFAGKQSDQLKSCEGNLIVFFSPEINDTLMVRTQLLIKGNIQPIRVSSNPYSYDHSVHLKNRGFQHQIFVRPDQYQITGKSKASWIERLRQKCHGSIHRLTDSPETRGILTAMVLGDRSLLPPKLKAAFADTGAIHTLAVSGLHVGIIAVLIGLFLHIIPSTSDSVKTIKSILSCLGIWGFAWLTGGSASVIRASVMFSFLILDYQWSGYKNGYNFLALSALIILVFDPMSLYSIGFQFSFLALLSIMLFYRKIQQLLPYLPNPILRYTWTLVAMSLAAQVLIFPSAIYYFHQFPNYFILSSLWAIPLTYLIVMLGVVILALSFIYMPLAEVGIWLPEKVTILLVNGIQWIQNLPGSTTNELWIPGPSMLILYILLGLLGWYFYKSETLLLKGIRASIIAFYLTLIIEDLNNLNFQKLILYDHHNTTLVEAIDGPHAITYTDNELDTTGWQFLAKNYHLAHGIKYHLSTNDRINLSAGGIYHRSGVLIVNQKVILLPSYGNEHFYGKADYLILSQKNLAKASSIIVQNEPKQILASSTVPKPIIQSLRKLHPNYIITSVQESGYIEHSL